MYYYEQMKYLDGKDLHDYIEGRIDALEFDADIVNADVDTIGYELDYNSVNRLNDDQEIYVDIRNFYAGYIPKGMRIVYGLSYNYDKNGLVGNDGKYYYLDTDDYIYEFYDYIRDKDIINEFELFSYLQEFLKKYFGLLPSINREEMFQMLYQDERNFYPPLEEHGLSWFKGKGNAMCTEYAVVAQNILNFFGIDSYIMIGTEKLAGEKAENHAFNIITYTEEETNEECNALIDFATPVGIYDIQFQYIGEFPFIGSIDTLDEEFVCKLQNQQERFVFSEYCYLVVGEDIIEFFYPKQRYYYVSKNLFPDPVKNKIFCKNR